jgi:hypothetical protein
MTRGKSLINDLKRRFANKICVLDYGGYWVRINHDRTRGEKIFVSGFPCSDIMEYVIWFANKTSPTHVIPSEELDGVLAEAEEATSPEGLRRRREERLRLEEQERRAKWDALSDADKEFLIAWAETDT